MSSVYELKAGFRASAVKVEALRAAPSTTALLTERSPEDLVTFSSTMMYVLSTLVAMVAAIERTA